MSDQEQKERLVWALKFAEGLPGGFTVDLAANGALIMLREPRGSVLVEADAVIREDRL